jgi:hypothetical protein
MSIFEVGKHRVRVWERGNQWRVAVDRAGIPSWFLSEAEAWAAGVREADRIDRAVPDPCAGITPDPRSTQETARSP